MTKNVFMEQKDRGQSFLALLSNNNSALLRECQAQVLLGEHHWFLLWFLF